MEKICNARTSTNTIGTSTKVYKSIQKSHKPINSLHSHDNLAYFHYHLVNPYRSSKMNLEEVFFGQKSVTISVFDEQQPPVENFLQKFNPTQQIPNFVITCTSLTIDFILLIWFYDVLHPILSNDVKFFFDL